MGARKRYVLAGTGGRGLGMFAAPLLKDFTEFCELAALFDANPDRLKAANGLLGTNLPVYTDYAQMLKEIEPDAAIVTTRDSTHAEFICRTLDAGKRAISEKPLCVDGRQCRQILAAAKRNRRKPRARCFVTHNMRYGPAIQELKRLIASGAIGQLKWVQFQENLDRRHGADYFRRWHRVKANSGGLLIHKASHHFDVLNYLIDSIPETLLARGGLTFYGKHGPFRHKRCEGCPHAGQCEFHVELFKNERTRKLYKEAERADGYIRDGCVFDREIDIEDQASVLYDYKNGVRVTYSLHAFGSYEGWIIQFEGADGRLELHEVHDTSWLSTNASQHGLGGPTGKHLYHWSKSKGFRELPIPEAQGSHGGADPQIRHDFFGRPFDAKPTPQMAPLEEAVQAVLIGHAANVSLARSGKLVRVQDFLKKG
ncbi:MAG: Gfo/Idh/MocA family oxidoreductase [Planctomycetota bacterium]|nr:Gfo/Idh/MocA family oxidoreductase [Planctomycetota bacterium]